MNRNLPEEIKSEIIGQIQDVEQLINLRESIYPKHVTQIDKQIFKYISLGRNDTETCLRYIYKDDRFTNIESKPENTISIGLGQQSNILVFVKKLSDFSSHYQFVQDVTFDSLDASTKYAESYVQELIQFVGSTVILLKITIIHDAPEILPVLKNIQIGTLELSNCSYDFFKSIGQTVAPLNSLKKLEVQDSIYNVDTEELRVFFPNLKELKISNSYDTTRFVNTENLSIILPSLKTLDITCEFFEIDGELDISSLEILNLSIYDEIERLTFNSNDSCKLKQFALSCPMEIDIESLKSCLSKVSSVLHLYLKIHMGFENLDLSTFNLLKFCKIEVQNIENFTLPSSNLQELDISCNAFSIDNGCLSNISDTLTCLKLFQCNIDNIKSISSLKNLEELYFESNNLDSFDITGFKALKVLHILDNNLTKFHIPDDENSYELRSLKLSYNSISKISNVQSLKKLKDLYLNDNRLSDVSDIKNMPSLVHVNLSRNSIETFFNFVGLINLKTVDSSNNKKLTKLEIIETIPLNIELLNFESCSLRDIPSKFENMQNLDSLNFAKNSILNFSKIINCPNLKTVDFSRNCITGKIHNLDQLTRLVKLNLSFNKIDEIDSLPPNVVDLKLYCCQLKKICSIENLANLKALNLEENRLTKIDAIRNCPLLTEITLSSNQLQSLPILEKLDNLTDFNAADNQITIIGYTSYVLPKLTRLDLGNNKLESLKSIKNYPSLKFLRVSNNGLKKQKTDFVNCPNLKKILL